MDITFLHVFEYLHDEGKVWQVGKKRLQDEGKYAHYIVCEHNKIPQCYKGLPDG